MPDREVAKELWTAQATHPVRILTGSLSIPLPAALAKAMVAL